MFINRKAGLKRLFIKTFKSYWSYVIVFFLVVINFILMYLTAMLHRLKDVTGSRPAIK